MPSLLELTAQYFAMGNGTLSGMNIMPLLDALSTAQGINAVETSPHGLEHSLYDASSPPEERYSHGVVAPPVCAHQVGPEPGGVADRGTPWGRCGRLR